METRAQGTSRKSEGDVLVRYTPQIGEQICARLAQGELWHQICNQDGLPPYTTLYAWRRKHPEFAEAYAQAREMAADYKADKALAIAQQTTAATASADRLHVGVLQWHAAKAAPHLYGAKAEAQGAPERYIIEVRQFENVVGTDGKLYVREIPKLDAGR